MLCVKSFGSLIKKNVYENMLKIAADITSGSFVTLTIGRSIFSYILAKKLKLPLNVSAILTL